MYASGFAGWSLSSLTCLFCQIYLFLTVSLFFLQSLYAIQGYISKTRTQNKRESQKCVLQLTFQECTSSVGLLISASLPQSLMLMPKIQNKWILNVHCHWLISGYHIISFVSGALISLFRYFPFISEYYVYCIYEHCMCWLSFSR